MKIKKNFFSLKEKLHTISTTMTTHTFAKSNAYDFFNDESKFQAIRKQFASGDNFRSFAALLGYTSDEISSFLEYGNFSCFDKAWNKWLNAKNPTMLDIISILFKLQKKVLARDLSNSCLCLYEYLHEHPEIATLGPEPLALAPALALELELEQEQEQELEQEPFSVKQGHEHCSGSTSAQTLPSS
jgi:hypothetical protein